MKNKNLKMALCVSLCAVIMAQVPALAQPQPKQHLSAEERAEMRAGKMKENLDLTEKQYKKLCKVFKKTEKAREQAMHQNGRPEGMRPGPGGRPGEGFRGGPGMPPGQGMPPRGGMRPGNGHPDGMQGKPESGQQDMKPDDTQKLEMPDMMSEAEIAAIEKETAKVRKILTDEQFRKWQQADDRQKKAAGQGKKL